MSVFRDGVAGNTHPLNLLPDGAAAPAVGRIPLYEVYMRMAEELAKAVDSGAEIIGVNNRNLDTFEVSLDTSRPRGLCSSKTALELGRSNPHFGHYCRQPQLYREERIFLAPCYQGLH